MLREVLGAPEDLPLEPVEHMSSAICSVIPSGVRCASARRLISELNLCDGAVLLARPAGPHTPPLPCAAASHDTGTPSKEFIIM